MEVKIKEAKNKGLFSERNGRKYYFCSLNCKKKFLEKKDLWYRSETFGKVFPWVFSIVLILGTILSFIFDFMLLYMGIFFILFSLLKMLDWKGFVNSFKEYDLLAGKLISYAIIYPAIEFILGIMFIYNFYIGKFYLGFALCITILIMGIGSISVSIKLAKRQNTQCACLGTWLNIPLTKATLLEDALMLLMAMMLLISKI